MLDSAPSRSLLVGFLLALLVGCSSTEDVPPSAGPAHDYLRAADYGPAAPSGIEDTAATPPHNMSRSDYPFDAQGNYQTSWATGGGGGGGGGATFVAEQSSSPVTTGPRPYQASRQYRYHVVKSGDTLYSISRRFDVSLHSVKSANNLSSNTIRTGQTLRIP